MQTQGVNSQTTELYGRAYKLIGVGTLYIQEYKGRHVAGREYNQSATFLTGNAVVCASCVKWCVHGRTMVQQKTWGQLVF